MGRRVLPRPEDATTQRALEVLEERINDLDAETRDQHGRWELIERKELTEDGAQIDFDGLDGDIDEEFLLRGALFDLTTTAGVYELLINNTDGTETRFIGSSAGVPVAGSVASAIQVAYGSTITPLYSVFEGTLLTRRGFPKIYTGTTNLFHAGGTEGYMHTAWFSDLTTKVTSLTVQHSTSTMARGSWVELYRKRRA